MSILAKDGASHGWRAGVRVGLGLAVAAFALAVSFGAAAVAAGWPAWLVVLMSAVVFAGGAQFALVLAFGGGGVGGIVAALGAATLINLRFIPMAITTFPRSSWSSCWIRCAKSRGIVSR